MRFLLAAFLLLPVVVQADGVDDYVRQQMRDKHLPGLSLCVVYRGKVVKSKGYGIADLEQHTAMRSDAVFPIGSLTKPIIASEMMRQVERGKLSLNDSVVDLLPDLPKAWKVITIRHLLSHTSGIVSLNHAPRYQENPREDYSPDQMLALVRDLPLQFDPGTKYAYSNTGYFILGLLLEKLSGETLDTLLKRELFRPIGMSDTHVNVAWDVVDRRIPGYHFYKDGLLKAEYDSPTRAGASGNLLSTALDLARWDLALDAGKVVRPQTLATMRTPVLGGAGLGFGVERINGHRFISHSGSVPGFTGFFGKYPDDSLTVIVLANAEPARPDEIARGVAGFYQAAIAMPGTIRVKDDHPKWTKTLRAALAALGAGKDAAAFFSPASRPNLATFAPEAKEVLSRFGTIRSVRYTGLNEGERFYEVQFTKRTAQFRVRFTPDGLLLMFDFVNGAG